MKVGTWANAVSVKLHQNGESSIGFRVPGISSVSLSASGKMYTFWLREGGVEPVKSSIAQDRNAQSTMLAPGSAISVGSFSDATIGVSTDVDPTVRHDGITLDRVASGGPADRAGIKPGDTILAIAGHYLYTAEELDAEIKLRQPGTRVAIRYRRYSTIYDTFLVVGSAR